jgi:hypothetical protein
VEAEKTLHPSDNLKEEESSDESQYEEFPHIINPPKMPEKLQTLIKDVP